MSFGRLGVRGPLRAPAQAVRNRTMEGAVAGQPGTTPTYWSTSTFAPTGATRTLALETTGGITYLLGAMAGTPSATTFAWGLDGTTQTEAAPGQVWSASAIFRKTAGDFTGFSAVTLAIREYDSGGSFLRQTTVDISGMTSTAQTYTASATIGASTAFVTLAIRVTTTGAAIGCTVGIGLPSLTR